MITTAANHVPVDCFVRDVDPATGKPVDPLLRRIPGEACRQPRIRADSVRRTDPQNLRMTGSSIDPPILQVYTREGGRRWAITEIGRAPDPISLPDIPIGQSNAEQLNHPVRWQVACNGEHRTRLTVGAMTAGLARPGRRASLAGITHHRVSAKAVATWHEALVYIFVLDGVDGDQYGEGV